MRNSVKHILTVLLTTVLLGSLTMIAWQSYRSRVAADMYAQAQELASPSSSKENVIPEQQNSSSSEEQTEDVTAVQQKPPVEDAEAPSTEEPAAQEEDPVADDPFLAELSNTDLSSLRAVNPDVVGWIAIPGTPISYPLMQGADNEFYLKHTWNGVASAAGSIFLESEISAALDDFNTIVYGHRMMNDSMFGSLKYYKETDYWKEHPYIYILDDAGVHRYEIFSIYEAAVRSYTYQIGFADDSAKEKFLNKCMEWSVVETNVTPTIRDRILTLSTCTGKGYDTRWVVQARLVPTDILDQR